MKVKEKVMEYVFLLCACVSILAVALICIFLFANGLPAMKEIGVFDFLLGKRWKPGNDIYGIFPMILGSIYVTAGAIIINSRSDYCRCSDWTFNSSLSCKILSGRTL